MILFWYIIKWSVISIRYVLLGMFAVVVCGASFLLNVFTVPIYLVVYLVQKRSGGKLPRVGRFLWCIYPRFTEQVPRQNVKTITRIYDPLFGWM